MKNLILTGFIVILALISPLHTPNLPGGMTASELDFYAELSECTTGVASGVATPDGRPLLWKTRDVGNPNQEYHYVDDGRIPFISLTYRNENTMQYYGGVNAEGFAIENSNCYNVGQGSGGNGWGHGDDDGEIHALALATCRTVDDFEVLLDSIQATDGITLCSNYGTFDAFGNAAIFETAAFTNVRCDAAETEDGFLVRSNFAYSGDGLNNRPAYWGPNRHDRAYAVWKAGAEANNLTAEYIYQNAVRCLHPAGIEDFELPYDGYYQDYPFGLIPNGETPCRSSSQSVFLAQGVREGERPDHSVIWAMPGNPIGCIVTPLWVRAGSVPIEHDDRDGSLLCEYSMDIRDYVVDGGNFGSAVNTWKLKNPQGTGYWDWSLGVESMVFERVERFRNSPNFSLDQLENFQNLIARQIADSIANWNPSFNSTEISDLVFWENNVVINWEPTHGEEIGRDHDPRGYNVFRSSHPFRSREDGQLVGFTEDTRFTDDNPIQTGSYYRVEAVY